MRTYPIGVVLGVLLIATGCAKSQPDDHAQVAAAIEKLRSGQTMAEIQNVAALANKLPTAPSLSPVASTSPTPAVATTDLGPDPCASVPKPAKDASPEEMHSALVALVGCWNDPLAEIQLYSAAMDYFELYILKEGTTPLSKMSVSELANFINKDPISIEEVLLKRTEKLAEVRRQFSDEDLAELHRLEKIKTDRALSIEKGIFASMDARPELLAYATGKSNRYTAMLAMGSSFALPDPSQGWNSFAALSAALTPNTIKIPENYNSRALLNPYGLLALIPSHGHEEAPLDRDYENPYTATTFETGNYVGILDDGEFSNFIKGYTDLRDANNPPIPAHSPAAPGAVRVAVWDTGIDFVRFPDLALFLGDQSADFTELDSNPYLSALAPFGQGMDFDYEWWHGSATTGSLLTVLAHYAPDILSNRQLELSVWKNRSITEALADRQKDMLQTWSGTYLFPGLYHQIMDAKVKPQIVSVSLGLTNLPWFLKSTGSPNLLKQAPWLWVMAAGNEGQDVSTDLGSADCFADVPAENKIDENILCVGALSQGIVNDQVASYSNYGSRVDVYAEESYLPLCPNGTSCSTPAIAAAATVIQARYPKLTPAQIRQVIIQAAEERELAVQPDPNAPNAPAVKRKVKVFNPPAMLDKALAIAAMISS